MTGPAESKIEIDARVYIHKRDPLTRSKMSLKRFVKDEKEKERLVKEVAQGSFQRRNENPGILIVTDMLLTGFDAPTEHVMYLDKPMRDHRLLQAIARTNRPYSGKIGGLVVDYVGIYRKI